jgi:hypothetical protein
VTPQEREAYDAHASWGEERDDDGDEYAGCETGDEPDACPSCRAEYDHEPDCALAGEMLRDLAGSDLGGEA